MMKNKEILFIGILWLIATFFNITKAVHIDDTAYIEEAVHIVGDPLHPMSGLVNWADTSELIRARHHPLLIPYLYALEIRLFGVSEFGLHILMSFFTLGTIFFFYILAKEFVHRYRYIFTIMFILGPAFLPGQNLMLDVPNVFFWLGFFWLILVPHTIITLNKKYISAALFIGLAIMTKYSGFILMLILFLDIFFRNKWKYFWVLIIPLVMVAGWSLFNYWEYGGIHILESQGTPMSIQRIREWSILWVVTLGSVSPFTLFLIPVCFKNKKVLLILVGSIILAVLYSRLNWGFGPESEGRYIFRLVFFMNGIFLLGCVIYYIFVYFRNVYFKIHQDKNVSLLLIIIWIGAGSVVMSIFVPTMAVRHVVIIIPAILLFLGKILYEKLSMNGLVLACFLSVFLGAALAVSDYETANVYRKYAPIMKKMVISLKDKNGDRGGDVYFAGHWGWQWYAKKEGLLQYDIYNTQFNRGDILVMPMTEQQYIPPYHAELLHQLDTIFVPGSAFTFMRTMSDPLVAPRGYYATGDRFLPWIISTSPLEGFRIYEVLD